MNKFEVLENLLRRTGGANDLIYLSDVERQAIEDLMEEHTLMSEYLKPCYTCKYRPDKNTGNNNHCVWSCDTNFGGYEEDTDSN